MLFVSVAGMAAAERVKIPVGNKETVSGLWLAPAKARACLVLAHGAGAGMAHKSMTAIAEGLSDRSIATMRFQFPYMERGNGRPDPPRIAHAAVRGAVSETRERGKQLPLFAGGKSFGGRMTSQAQALLPLAGAKGLVFFGFPLHPAGAPSVERAEHLKNVTVPMLFLQGTRDALASLELLRTIVASLAPLATLELIEQADHSFHVPKRTGRKDSEVLATLLDCAASWMIGTS
jgi:uncharacterized protein